MSHIIIGAAYIGPYSLWTWITVVAVVIIGIFLFWILYKLVLCRMDWGKGKAENRTKVKIHKVDPHKLDQVDEEGITPIAPKEEMIEAGEVIVMPFSGQLMTLDKVPDPIFSERMVGDGFAIKHGKGRIKSPVKGTIKEISSRKTSITFNTTAGRDVILHIGLNKEQPMNEIVDLEIKEGDRVALGQDIGFIDFKTSSTIKNMIISPVVFPKLKEEEHIEVKEQGLVEAGMKDIVVIEEEKQ